MPLAQRLSFTTQRTKRSKVVKRTHPDNIFGGKLIDVKIVVKKQVIIRVDPYPGSYKPDEDAHRRDNLTPSGEEISFMAKQKAMSLWMRLLLGHTFMQHRVKDY